MSGRQILQSLGLPQNDDAAQLATQRTRHSGHSSLVGRSAWARKRGMAELDGLPLVWGTDGCGRTRGAGFLADLRPRRGCEKLTVAGLSEPVCFQSSNRQELRPRSDRRLSGTTAAERPSTLGGLHDTGHSDTADTATQRHSGHSSLVGRSAWARKRGMAELDGLPLVWGTDGCGRTRGAGFLADLRPRRGCEKLTVAGLSEPVCFQSSNRQELRPRSDRVSIHLLLLTRNRGEPFRQHTWWTT